MMTNSGSFESPKTYLFGHYLKNSITALLRYVILAQNTPILLHTEGLVSFVSLSTVSRVRWNLFFLCHTTQTQHFNVRGKNKTENARTIAFNE